MPFTPEQYTELDRRIETASSSVKSEIKIWIFSTILVNVIGFAPLVFFIGGIYSQISNTFEVVKEMDNTNKSARVWMTDRERWESSMEAWALERGWKPPRNSARSINEVPPR